MRQVKAEPNERVIQAFTEALERAKAGELQCVLIVGIDNTGQGISRWECPDDLVPFLISQVEGWKFQMFMNAHFSKSG